MSPGRVLPLRHRSYWLMRQTKTLPPIPVPFVDGSSQVVANPCWEMVLPDVISAFLVWVLGPIPRNVTSVRLPVSSRGATAIAQGARSSAHPTIPAKQFPRGILYRGCSHSLMFRPPHSLGPPAAPTAGRKRRSLGGRAVYTAQNPVGYLPRAAASLHARNRAIGMVGLSPTGMQPCRLLPHPLDDERNLMESSHLLQSQSTSSAWSHQIPYPPSA
jgi:hypothetical protein